MTNREIDLKLKVLANEIPLQEKELRENGVPKIERELDLMNITLVAIVKMLGEIAKRLPEPDKSE
jgi:hypothetical protein